MGGYRSRSFTPRVRLNWRSASLEPLRPARLSQTIECTCDRRRIVGDDPVDPELEEFPGTPRAVDSPRHDHARDSPHCSHRLPADEPLVDRDALNWRIEPADKKASKLTPRADRVHATRRAVSERLDERPVLGANGERARVGLSIELAQHVEREPEATTLEIENEVCFGWQRS